MMFGVAECVVRRESCCQTWAMRHIEHERKFDIVPGRRIPDLGSYSLGAPRRIRLTATYIDTPDLRLTLAKVTLRRRTGGHDAGWHLKLPDAGDRRIEIQAPLSQGKAPSRVPLTLREEVREIADGLPLVPVAVMRTSRTEREIRTARGRLVGILTDDTVRVESWRAPWAKDADHDGQSWRELEIELASSSAAQVRALDELTTLLAGADIPVSKSSSKIGRFLADRVAQSTPLEPRPEWSAERGAAAIDAVLAYIRTQVGVIQWREADVIADVPDAVHKSRVAARRLRSALRTARRLFDADITEPLRAEVRWWGEVLGGPRDAEVFRESLNEALDTLPHASIVGPIRQRVVTESRRAHERTHAIAVRQLHSRRYANLMTALCGLVESPPLRGRATQPAAQVLPTLVTGAVKRVDRNASRARKASTDERDHWLHETRKKSKAARYLGESLKPVFGDAATDFAERFERVTDALGEVQDAVVAVERLTAMRERARRAGEPTETYDELIRRRQAMHDEHEQAAQDALAAIADPDMRQWFE